MSHDLIQKLSDPERLDALRGTHLLDTLPEPPFDRLTRLAARLLDAPIALVSLVDEHRQFFKSCIGLAEPWATRRETPLSHSFCKYVVQTDAPFLVTDAPNNPLVCDNLAISELGVVAYAGVPLSTSQGQTLGSFCVIDTCPREWTQEHVTLLADLAASVVSEIELSVATETISTYTAEPTANETGGAEVSLPEQESIIITDQNGLILEFNAAAEAEYGFRREDVLGKSVTEVLIPPESRQAYYDAIERSVSGESDTQGQRIELMSVRADGTEVPTELAITLDSSHKLPYQNFRSQEADRSAQPAQSLQHEPNLTSAILPAVDALILTMDRQGHIITFNRACAQITGYTEAEVYGRLIWDVLLEEPTAGQAREFFQNIDHLPSDAFPHHHEANWLTRMGDKRLISWSTNVIRGAANRVTHVIATGMDVTLQRAVEATRGRLIEILEATPDYIGTCDPKGNILYMNRSLRNLLGVEVSDGPYLHTVSEYLQPAELDQLRTVGVPTVLKEGLWSGETSVVNSNGELVPVSQVILAHRTEKGEVDFLSTIARDITATRRAERRLTAHYTVTRVLAEAATIEEATPQILQVLGECLDWSVGELWLRDGSNHLQCAQFWSGPNLNCHSEEFKQEAFALRFAPGVGLPGQVWQRSQPIWIKDVTQESGFVRRSSAEKVGLCGAIGFPIIGNDEFLGAILLLSRKMLSSDDEMIRMMVALGSQIGQFIQRKRAEAALAVARENEVEIGSKIQQTLLVHKPLPTPSGFSVGALSLASQRVDGDYFDFFLYDDFCFDMLIGDVMGKGITAALLSAASKSHFQRAIRRLILELREHRRLPQPAEILTAVHATMSKELVQLDSFITLCYTRFDRQSKQMTMIDCGHTRTIHYRAQSRDCVLLQGENLPLGVRDEETYIPTRVSLEVGDILFFYSDGVTETRSADGSFYGEDRLMETVRSGSHLEAHDLVEYVSVSVREFSGTDQLSDDLTCVAIRMEQVEREAPLCYVSREFNSDLKELETIRKYVRGFCQSLAPYPLDDSAAHLTVLAVNEAITNIVKHAYGGEPGNCIQVIAEAYSDRIEFQLRDWGKCLNRDLVQEPDFDGSRDNGFGIHIMEQCMDGVIYVRDDLGRNSVRMTKRTAKADPGGGST